MEALGFLQTHAQIDSEYDVEADVLYLTAGAPRPAEGIDIGDGLVVRFDPEKKEVVGLTVIGLQSRLARSVKGSTTKA